MWTWDYRGFLIEPVLILLEHIFDPKNMGFFHENDFFGCECNFLGGFGKWRYSLKYASDQGGVNESLEKYRCEL